MSAHPSFEDLSALLDGELPGDRVAALEAHVRTCASCASWLDDVRASESLVGAPPAEAPPGYHEAFVERLRPRLATRATRRPWAWTAAAAAALLAVVLAPAVLREKTSLAPAPAHDEVRPPAPALEAQKNAVPPPVQARPQEPAPDRAGAAPPAAPPAPIPQPRPEPKRQAEESSGRADADFAEPPQLKKDAPPPPAAAGMTQPADDERALARDAVASETGGKLEETVSAAPPAAATPAPPAGYAANELDGAREQQKAMANRERAEGRLAAGAAAPAAAPARSREAEIADLRRRREDWRRKAEAAPTTEDARLQVVETGLRVYRLSGLEADRTQALADAERYLADAQAPARERVRALRRELER